MENADNTVRVSFTFRVSFRIRVRVRVKLVQRSIYDSYSVMKVGTHKVH